MLTFHEHPAQLRAVQLTCLEWANTQRQSDRSDINYLHKLEVLPVMFLQLHLHERKLFPIASISVADQHAQHRDNIHLGSLAQRRFRPYKLRSPSANLLSYTKLVNLTVCSLDKKSPPAWLHGHYPQSTIWDPLKSWQYSHLECPLITHGNATVQGVAWDCLWSVCPGSLAPSPVSLKPSTVNHTTTRRSKYARRWFPGYPGGAPGGCHPHTPYISCEQLLVSCTATTNTVLWERSYRSHFTRKHTTTQPYRAVAPYQPWGRRRVLGISPKSHGRFGPLLLRR